MNRRQRATDGADGLAQRAIRDNDVAPDAIEDVAAMHRLMPMLDQKDQQIEVARNQRLVAAVAKQHPAAGREDEFVEAIAGHDVGLGSLRKASYQSCRGAPAGLRNCTTISDPD